MPPKKKSPAMSKGGKTQAGGRAWRDAIRLELARADGPSGTALERIARIVVNNALNGDFEAIQEVANRIDGKVAVQEHHEAGEPISKLIVTWESPRERIKAGEPMKIIEHSPSGTDGGVQVSGGQEAAFPPGGGPKIKVDGPSGPGGSKTYGGEGEFD